MPTVIEDLANGHRVSRVRAATELTRIFHVSGLTADPHGQLLEAMEADGDGVPQLGDTYPDATAYFVIRQDAEPAGAAAAIVTCVYSNQSGTTWNQDPPTGDGDDVKQISSSVVQKKRTRDRTGTAMTIDPPAAYEGWPSYVSEADVLAPVGSIIFERTEDAPPSARMRGYVGQVNSATISGYAARTLLCARIDSQSDDGGRTWRTVYEFRYDPDTWDHVDSYHAPDGKVPDGAAVETFELQDETAFSGLSLDFSDTQAPI